MQSNCFKHTFSYGQKTAEGPQLAVTVRGQDQTLTVATVSQMSPADFSSLWRVSFVHWIHLYAVKFHCHQGICWHCKCHMDVLLMAEVLLLMMPHIKDSECHKAPTCLCLKCLILMLKMAQCSKTNSKTAFTALPSRCKHIH